MGKFRTWDGGRILVDSDGRDVYQIRKQINGKRYEVSTRCHSTKAAHEQLKRFEADPEGYMPSGLSSNRLVLDEALRDEFLAWSELEKKNTKTWVGQQRLYLTWWMEKIGSHDLHKMTLDHILPHLADPSAKSSKISVLKVFYTWLVKVKRALKPAQDPTFRALESIQAKPAQWKKSKVIKPEDYRLVLEALEGHWRDGLEVLAGTGWHVTELVRFVISGDVEKHQKVENSVVLTCPATKGGEVLRTAVSLEVGAAGRRLRKRGAFDRDKFDDAVKEASEKAGVKPHITPGRFRHSVATWAINNGADPAQVAAFLGHKSPRTTRKFYATHAVPVKVPTLA